MTEAQSHLANLVQLLQLEREAELERFESFMKSAPVKQRVAQGKCWYPVEVRETGYALGDYPSVVVQRALTGGHQFQAGAMVNVFSSRPEYEGLSAKGSIKFVDRQSMKIIFYEDQHPDWLSSGKIGIDLAPDLHTFKEMERALSDVMNADRNRVAELREVLVGEKAPRYEEDHHDLNLPKLNQSQNEAINTAMRASDVAIIHGPPGTGKTTTLVALIKQLVKRERRVLVIAPSNAATDLLTERCSIAGLKVMRLGNLSRVDKNLVQHTPEGRLAEHGEANTLKQMKRKAQEMRRLAGKYKRNFGAAEREQRKALYREARDLAKEAVALETSLIDSMLHEAQVVCCTPVGSTSYWMRGHQFKTVVIDEAAQALEPICWIPIRKAEKVVLAGDPLQLPPTVMSQEAARKGLTKTLIEHCIPRFDKVSLLDTQYRMHEAIMGFSNHWFYEGALKAHESVAQHTTSESDPRPFEFIDTAGCGFEEEREHEAASTANSGEADILIKHLQAFLADLPAGDSPSIGVISPYKAQVHVLEEKLKEADLEHISVNTVDAFQGQERDVIYISTARSNEDGVIGFLSDYRRMNVALTRARKKLIVIGDSATLGGQKFYEKLLDYVEKEGAYRTAWEFMY